MDRGLRRPHHPDGQPRAGRLRQEPRRLREGLRPHPQPGARARHRALAGRDVRSRAGRLLGLARPRSRRWRPLLAIVSEHAAKIDGIKISLLDQAREIAMRRRLPAGRPHVHRRRLRLPDDDRAATGSGYSDALLGIFDAIAPAAAAALTALDRGDLREFERSWLPRSRSRATSSAPPRASTRPASSSPAYLNGHQSHFRMVGGMESARSIVHLGEQFRLMDAAGLLRDPEMAAARMRAPCWPSPGSSSRAPADGPGRRHPLQGRPSGDPLHALGPSRGRAPLQARAIRAPLARGVRRGHRPGVSLRHRGERPAQLAGRSDRLPAGGRPRRHAAGIPRGVAAALRGRTDAVHHSGREPAASAGPPRSAWCCRSCRAAPTPPSRCTRGSRTAPPT